MEKYNLILIQSEDETQINELFLIKKSTTLIGSDQICDIVLDLDNRIDAVHVRIKNSNDIGIEDVSSNGRVIKERDGLKISLKKGKEYEFLTGRYFYIDEKLKLKISLIVGSQEELNNNININKFSCFEHYLNSVVHEQSIIKAMEETGKDFNENIEKIRGDTSPSSNANQALLIMDVESCAKSLSKSKSISAQEEHEEKKIQIIREDIFHNDCDLNALDYLEEMNINKINEEILDKERITFTDVLYEISQGNFVDENEKVLTKKEEVCINFEKYSTPIVEDKQEYQRDDYDQILNLPSILEQNTPKKIEENLPRKNSENFFNAEVENGVPPSEISDQQKFSQKNILNETCLSKMLEAANLKNDSLEKNIIEIISNRIKESAIKIENENDTPVILNSDLKSIRKYSKIIKEDLLSSKRKRDLTRRDSAKNEDIEIQINSNTNLISQKNNDPNLIIIKRNLQNSFGLNNINTINSSYSLSSEATSNVGNVQTIFSKQKKISSYSLSSTVTPSETKNFNPNDKFEETDKSPLNFQEKIESQLPTPNILKISIDNDATIDSKLLRKIRCIKCEIVDEQESEYDILICNKLSKKFKILLAINNRKPILSSKWLEDSISNKMKMPYDKYYTKDKEFEKKFNLDLFKILNETPYATYMEEYYFYVSDHVPNKDEIEELIESAGGFVCETYKKFKKTRENLVIIVDKNNDREFIKILKAKGNYKIYIVDLIINSVIFQELEIDKAKYKI